MTLPVGGRKWALGSAIKKVREQARKKVRDGARKRVQVSDTSATPNVKLEHDSESRL